MGNQLLSRGRRWLRRHRRCCHLPPLAASTSKFPKIHLRIESGADAALAEEEAEDKATEQTEIEVPAILPMPTESIPGAALLEAASSSRRSTRRDTSIGQLSLF